MEKNDSKPIVVIAGGSGMLGKKLYTLLANHQFQPVILSRSANVPGFESAQWNPAKGEIDRQVLSQASAIVNLAGRSVGDKRWNDSFKQSLVDSRKQSTQLLVKEVNNLGLDDVTFVNASATGYYGFHRGEEVLKEDADPGNDFFGHLCFEWEKEAKQLEHPERLVIFRLGVVLDKREGAYPKLKAPILASMGSPIGSGKQWFPWIHVDDALNAMLYAIKSKALSGTYNLVAPERVTNRKMMKEMANSLNKQMLLPNVPAFAIKLLVGEFAKSLLGSLRVDSQKLQQEGFEYRYGTLESAIRELNWSKQ